MRLEYYYYLLCFLLAKLLVLSRSTAIFTTKQFSIFTWRDYDQVFPFGYQPHSAGGDILGWIESLGVDTRSSLATAPRTIITRPAAIPLVV